MSSVRSASPTPPCDRAAVAAAVAGIDHDEARIGRNVAASASRTSSRSCRRRSIRSRSRRRSARASRRGGLLRRRNDVTNAAAAGSRARRRRRPTPICNLQTRCRRRERDGLLSVERQRDANRGRIDLAHAHRDDAGRTRFWSMGPPCSCEFLMSTQKRLSGSRRRCHSNAASPVTAIETTTPSSAGATVTPVTVAGPAADSILLRRRLGLRRRRSRPRPIAASPAANASDTSRSSSLRGAAAIAPGASCTVTSVVGLRTVPEFAIVTERTPPTRSRACPPGSCRRRRTRRSPTTRSA